MKIKKKTKENILSSLHIEVLRKENLGRINNGNNKNTEGERGKKMKTSKKIRTILSCGINCKEDEEEEEGRGE